MRQAEDSSLKGIHMKAIAYVLSVAALLTGVAVGSYSAGESRGSRVSQSQLVDQFNDGWDTALYGDAPAPTR